MSQRSIGRPMKYAQVLLKLDPDELYTPASIVHFAVEKGLLEIVEDYRINRIIRQRMRIALGRFSNNHGFPDEGDGSVTIKGQSPTPGWFGWRWQEVIKNK